MLSEVPTITTGSLTLASFYSEMGAPRADICMLIFGIRSQRQTRNADVQNPPNGSQQRKSTGWETRSASKCMATELRNDIDHP